MRALVRIGLLVASLSACFNLFSVDDVTRVTAISADSITLGVAGGMSQWITVELMPSTLFIQDGPSVSWTDLRIGAQAEVHATNNDHGLCALNVIFKNPPARSHTGPSPVQEKRSYDAFLEGPGHLGLATAPEPITP